MCKLIEANIIPVFSKFQFKASLRARGIYRGVIVADILVFKRVGGGYRGVQVDRGGLNSRLYQVHIESLQPGGADTRVK